MNSKGPDTLTRCARGLLLLPNYYRDVVEAKRLLDEVSKICPNNCFLNHVMAQYYEKRGVGENLFYL